LASGHVNRIHMAAPTNAAKREESLANSEKAGGKKLGTFGKAAAKARDKDLKPVLKELAHLSPRAVVAEMERRGLGKVSYKTIARARKRLGIEKGAAS
jgi:hypothetical protein